MTSRGTLPASLLPMGVKHNTDDLLLKDQINILGWLNPTKDLNLATCHDRKSEYEKPVGNKPDAIHVAGDMEFHVSEGPQDAIFKVNVFLSKEVVAEVTHDSKDLQKIEAAVFVDFVELQVEVSIQSAEDHTTVVVKDRSRSDVVQWHHFCEQLKESFSQQNEQVHQHLSPQDLQPELLPMYSFDEFDDDWVDSQSMRDKAEALLDDVASRNATVRVQGTQVLASWARECPECRQHIAEAMLKNDVQILEALLQNSNVPLAEAYPLAATLRYTLFCPNAASTLMNSGIALRLLANRTFNNESTAAIVAKELSMAVRCLDMVTH